MASYTKMTVGKENRTELHEKLALTGAEISLNTLPAGANVPFVHSHKANEEIYGVLSNCHFCVACHCKHLQFDSQSLIA